MNRPWVETVPPMGTVWMPRVADVPNGQAIREQIERDLPFPSTFEGMPTRVLFRAGLDTRRVNHETGWTLDF